MLSQVFADELLRNQSLRRYLMKVDSVSSTIEKLFVCHFNQGDIGSVLEVITIHFIMSVSNEKAFEDFTSGFFYIVTRILDFLNLALRPP